MPAFAADGVHGGGLGHHCHVVTTESGKYLLAFRRPVSSDGCSGSKAYVGRSPQNKPDHDVSLLPVLSSATVHAARQSLRATPSPLVEVTNRAPLKKRMCTCHEIGLFAQGKGQHWEHLRHWKPGGSSCGDGGGSRC